MINSLRNIGLKFSLVLFTGCLFLMPSCTKSVGEGASIGAAVGAAAGALIDRENRWRGASIGSALGAIFGGSLADISEQASREAAREGRPVVYRSEDGYRRIEATPQDFNKRTNCHKVRERVWEDGQLVKDTVNEVCESEKTENVY